jgi:hypothetical protein
MTTPDPFPRAVKPDYGTTHAKAVPDLPPLKPRPVLFVVLGIILALWLAVLVLMRLTTVNRPLFTPATTQPTSRPV